MFDITTSALNALLDEEPEILSILPRGMTEAQRSTKDHFVHRIQATCELQTDERRFYRVEQLMRDPHPVSSGLVARGTLSCN